MGAIRGNRNFEAGIRIDVEVRARFVGEDFLGAVDLDFAGAVDDFHAFSSGGIEVIFPGLGDAEGFGGTVLKSDAVGDDFAVEIDVA